MMEYKLSPVLAAAEGDTKPLCQRLRAIATKLGETDAAVVRCAADLIEGKLKLPQHRPPSLKTHLKARDIARRVEELTSKPGERERRSQPPWRNSGAAAAKCWARSRRIVASKSRDSWTVICSQG
jgi:hypothetical protein